MNARRIIALFFIFAAACSAPRSVSAARMFWEAVSAPPAATGKAFALDLMLDTEGERVNAIEGMMEFAHGGAAILAADHGGSVVPLWIRAPRPGGSGVMFSGLIPGGLVADRARLFSVVIAPRSTGAVEIAVRDMRAFRDDPPGSPVSLRAEPFILPVGKEGGDAFVPPSDNDPPEPFVPVIARNDRLFGGRWFVAFTAQDKGRGIVRYEIAEEQREDPKDASWIEAASPYELTDQERRSYVFVRAVDGAGNERISRVDPLSGDSRSPRTFGIISIWAVVVIFVLSSWWRRKMRTP